MASLTTKDLIDESTGKVRREVLWSLVVRRAGSKELCMLKVSRGYYETLIRQMVHDWRARHGLPVETVPTDIIGSD